ncbi:hypothetical protein N9L47_07970 [Rhodobacteraceae bacterium]|nr:hypothetical protein [Paracoccaceae bacterium]
MVKIVFGAALALCTASATVAQDTVTWADDIRGWNVSIDRTIDDSCFIIFGFANEMFLRFQFNAAQQNVQFIVASVQWDSVETGQDYDVEVAFGDLDPWAGAAKGHRWNEILPSLVLSVPVADQQASHFVEEFTAKESVRISYGGSEIATLVLTGVEEAVASMLDCQAAMSKAESLRDSGTDPFASKPDPI